MRALFKLSLILIGIAGAIWWALQPDKVSNNLVLLNGTIVTVDDEMHIAEALWIKDGRIMAVGAKADVLAHADGADTYDLDGKTVIPGLIEPHTHPFASALLGQAVDVSGFKYSSRYDIIKALEDAAVTGSGPIIAFGWDPVLIKELTAPSLAELDRIAPDRPLVILTQMMHDAYANSAAYAAAGITRDTPDPEGGFFMRDKDGNLNGTIREVSAINQMFGIMPKAPDGAFDLLLNLQLRSYALAGYTTIGALGPSVNEGDPLGMLSNLADMSDPAVRTVVYALPAQLENEAYQAGQKSANGRYYLRGVKFWMDGSPFAGGAAFADPYEDSKLTRKRLHLHPPHYGAVNYSANDFEAQFRKYHSEGFAIAIHAQGERAIDRVLDVAEKVMKDSPRPDARHRLEHNALITKAQIARAKNLGLTLSFFVDHIFYYGHRLPEIVGDARTKRYMPLGDADRAGHRVTFHTDNPATPIGPFRAMQTATTRRNRTTGDAIAPDQALTQDTALRALTINSAWQLGLDEEIGSLEVGKRADLTFLDQNPLTVDPDLIKLIRPVDTWIDGQPAETDLISATNAKLVWNVVLNYLR